MAEILDVSDHKDPRNVQRRIKLQREQFEAEQHAKLQGVGILRGFTDEQLLDELDRRHPDVLAGSGSERWGAGSWPETAGQGLTDDTNKGGQIPTQAEADAVVAQAAAEQEQRNAQAGQSTD